MTVLTEGQHQGEFLVSEGNGSISREVGTLTAGTAYKDGDVLKLVAGKLQQATQAESSEEIVGIMYGDVDATGGDVAGVPYITRLAEVKLALIRVNANPSVPDAGVLAELAARMIIAR